MLFLEQKEGRRGRISKVRPWYFDRGTNSYLNIVELEKAREILKAIQASPTFPLDFTPLCVAREVGDDLRTQSRMLDDVFTKVIKEVRWADGLNFCLSWYLKYVAYGGSVFKLKAAEMLSYKSS